MATFPEGAVVSLRAPGSENLFDVWRRGEIDYVGDAPNEARFRWDRLDAFSVNRGGWTRLQRPDATRRWCNDAALGCDWIEGEETSGD